jgi:hypothetical protein
VEVRETLKNNLFWRVHMSIEEALRHLRLIRADMGSFGTSRSIEQHRAAVGMWGPRLDKVAEALERAPTPIEDVITTFQDGVDRLAQAQQVVVSSLDTAREILKARLVSKVLVLRVDNGEVQGVFASLDAFKRYVAELGNQEPGDVEYDLMIEALVKGDNWADHSSSVEWHEVK